VVFKLLQQLEALGLNLPAILQQLGVNPAAIASTAAAAAPPVVSAVVVPPQKLD